MEDKCSNCYGTGNVVFDLGVLGHTVVRCAVCHGTGQSNLTHISQVNGLNASIGFSSLPVHHGL